MNYQHSNFMHSLSNDYFVTFQLKSLNCYARLTFHSDLAWKYDLKNSTGICSNSFKIQIQYIFLSSDIHVFISMYYD